MKTERDRKIMSETFESLAEKLAEELVEKRVLDEKINIIRNLMESTKWTAEQAMEAMKIPETDKELLMSKL